jgi:hypothetical protein
VVRYHCRYRGSQCYSSSGEHKEVIVVVTHALQLLITGKSLVGPALKSAGDAVAGLSQKVQEAGGVLSQLGNIGKTAFKMVVTGAVAAAAAVAGLVTAFIGLPAAIGAATAKITDYAAGLDLARDAMWAITGEAMPAMVQSLKEASAFMVEEKILLSEYHKAYMLLGQDMATRVPEAMQYLIKVAALTGDTVENLTTRMFRSVGRLSTRWMAYIGVVVTVKEAEARAMEMFSKTADALTYEEKQAGMLDLTLEKLAARTSILPDVMGSAKQMSEALKVSWKDLGAEASTHLLPVAQGLYRILLKLTGTFKRLVTEGGALYIPIRKVTAAFTVLLEILGDLLDKALEVEEGATSALERFANNVISMAWKAVQWGSNIAVNLASGIVRGASTALIAAMNFISNLLAHWLSPGSAPLVVSNILNWGASAFTEFLRGFTMADFDILEGVQGPLKRALSILVNLDEMGEIEAGEYFIRLSEMMAEAIATGDPGAVFAKLAEIPGGYGESLAELYRRQLDLGAAVERLAAAEARLAAARKAEEASGVKLSKQAREYNRLVRAGASPEVLAAKLAEVKASYAALVAAREETEAAEEEEEAAEALVKWQREQVRLQERLLNQLIEMGQAFADLVPGGGDGDGDGDEPFVVPPIVWPEGYLVPVDTAFEALKESIRAKFAALWADLRAQWEESGAGQAIADLKARWDEFSENTLEPLKAKLGEVWATFKGWVSDAAWPWVVTQWGKWSAWWDAKGPGIIKWLLGIGDAPYSYKNLWAWVVTEWDKWAAWWEKEGPIITEAIASIGEFLDDLLGDLWMWVTGGKGWEGAWAEAGKILTFFTEKSLILMSGWMDQLRNYISLGLRILEGDWEGAWEEMKNISTTTMDTINQLTNGKFYELIAIVGNFIGSFAQKGAEIGQALLTGITNKWEEFRQFFCDIPRRATVAILGEMWRLANAGHQIMDALRNAIIQKAQHIANAFNWVIQRAIDAFLSTLGMHSESKVFFGFGQNLAESFTSGIEDFSHKPAIAVTHMADFTGVTAQAAIGPSKEGYAATPIIIHNHFGRDSIRSDRDVLLIADQIQRSLELKGVRGGII